MEFYKLVSNPDGLFLEEEQGQTDASLNNQSLSRLAQLLYCCYERQEQLPLRFRRYLTAYYSTGEMEYIALADGSCLSEKPQLDGFATTWLEGEEENRVWIGADGAIENRGPSRQKVHAVLERILEAFGSNQDDITVSDCPDI